MANPIKAVKAVGRAVGGITGKGSKNVNPVYKNTISNIPSTAHPKLHVNVSSKVKLVPSAEMKKTNAPFGPTSGAKQVMKENAKPVSKSKRGLKAANKIKFGSKSVAHDKEKNDYKYWDKAYNQFAKDTGKKSGTFGISTENALKFSKPARPNRVRGGSMGSKVNWPKGMK